MFFGLPVARERLHRPAGIPIILIDSVARAIRIGGTAPGPAASPKTLEGVVCAPDLDPPLPVGGLRGLPSKTKMDVEER